MASGRRGRRTCLRAASRGTGRTDVPVAAPGSNKVAPSGPRLVWWPVLAPGGAFVIECFVPDVASFDRGQRVQAVAASEQAATIRVWLHDAAQQRVTTRKSRRTGMECICIRWPCVIPGPRNSTSWPRKRAFSSANAAATGSGSRSKPVSVYRGSWRRENGVPPVPGRAATVSVLAPG
jgi:hypothetical protein